MKVPSDSSLSRASFLSAKSLHEFDPFFFAFRASYSYLVPFFSKSKSHRRNTLSFSPFSLESLLRAFSFTGISFSSSLPVFNLERPIFLVTFHLTAENNRPSLLLLSYSECNLPTLSFLLFQIFGGKFYCGESVLVPWLIIESSKFDFL